jgi:hypothetical protein
MVFRPGLGPKSLSRADFSRPYRVIPKGVGPEKQGLEKILHTE